MLKFQSVNEIGSKFGSMTYHKESHQPIVKAIGGKLEKRLQSVKWNLKAKMTSQA